MPSILENWELLQQTILSSFKPCYNWNAFNTRTFIEVSGKSGEVLNLIITGIQSWQI